jgi:very-short-patch-repair endonuclease
MLPFDRNLEPLARQLRKNMTDAELALWSKLRRKQLNGRIFYRQKNIGNYIVDFFCPSAKLVVEIDGGRHYSLEGRAKDNARDKYLAKEGLKVLRFSDLDVFKNMEGVLFVLYEHTPPTALST